VTGALASAINADTIEIGILIGKIEVEAKLNKTLKILKHKKDPRVKELKSIIESLEVLRPLRNAITHGHYLGVSNRKEIIFSLPTEFLVGDSPTANAMFVIYPNDTTKHFNGVVENIYKIIALFGIEKTHELLALPIRLSSYSPSKEPRKPQDKNRAKRQRPQKSSRK
jgi:hypothetical protein